MAESQIWILIGCVLALIIIIIVLILLFKNKKKSPKIKVDSAFIDNVINLLGGIDNLLSTEVENGRLRLKIKNLDIVNLDGLKGLSQAGVFVTGDCIKLLFKTDSQTIKKELDKKIK